MKIDTEKWQKFIVGDLFTIKRPKARSLSKYENGEVPFVASGNYNNGILDFCEPHTDEILDSGNCITISPVDGSTFYQSDNFLGRGGAGSSILLLYNDNLNQYNALFVCSVMRTVFTKFVYNDMANGNNIREQIIKLPIDKQGNPDWKYMEDYMRQIEKRVQNNLQYLRSAV